MGDSSRQRFRYVIVAGSLSLLVGLLVPSTLIAPHVWWFVAASGLIAFVGGVGEYGLLSAFCSRAPSVAVIGEAAFLASSSADYSLGVILPRLLLLLVVATATIAIPAYLLGAGGRRVDATVVG